MQSRASKTKRKMARIQKLAEQKDRTITRRLLEQAERDRDWMNQRRTHIAQELSEQKKKAMMEGIRRVFEQSKKTMSGISYLIDAQGRRAAVQIDLTKHPDLWYYIEDWLVSRTWRDAAESLQLKTKRRRRVLKHRSAKPARGR